MDLSTRPYWSLSLTAFITFLAACSGSPPRAESESNPKNGLQAWTIQPARTVEGGYIVYVGSGEDRDLAKARFKAESMALQDLANECSFAPKGTRTEDRADAILGVLHQSFAKVAVDFQDCEAAKAAVEPTLIRALASAPISEQLARYRQSFDAPNPEETQEDSWAGPALPSPAETQASRWLIQNPQQWMVVRQQIVFAKERVILAPPVPAGAPLIASTRQWSENLKEKTLAVKSFDKTHPEYHAAKDRSSFSMLRPRSLDHTPSALREPSSPRQAPEINSHARAEKKRLDSVRPRASARNPRASHGGKRKRAKRQDENTEHDR